MLNKSYLGIDIGGTKCAVIRGKGTHIDAEKRFMTTGYSETLERLIREASGLMTADIEAVGVSCGGPLDSKKGIIQSPPNLPGWDDVPITELLSHELGIKAFLCNDADACALAEWKYGAGIGSQNMIFLTFGTGMGAGLILNGRLYSGSHGRAGEIGHVTLYPDGTHIGYRKRGSVEGYCSGGGIAQYGRGTAKELAEKAEKGDCEAIRIYEKTGEDLGKTIAILTDLFDPEVIVIGSIYARAQKLLKPSLMKAFSDDALPGSPLICEIKPAALGEQIGSVAALTVAETGNEL